jgi:SAM-dependent methyltransferase
MSLSYRLMYLLGFTPWDRDSTPAALRAIIEGPAARRPGRALDIGCGMGRHAIYLAQSGWQVTGIDRVGRALRVARRRAADRGVAADFIEADVTRLDGATFGEIARRGPFDLLLDAGCFHSMPHAERRRYGTSIARLAATDAELLMLAFSPRRRRPGPRGAAQQDIARSLGSGWDMLWSSRDPELTRLHLVGPVEATWYRFRRRGGTT